MEKEKRRRDGRGGGTQKQKQITHRTCSFTSSWATHIHFTIKTTESAVSFCSACHDTKLLLFETTIFLVSPFHSQLFAPLSQTARVSSSSLLCHCKVSDERRVGARPFAARRDGRVWSAAAFCCRPCRLPEWQALVMRTTLDDSQCKDEQENQTQPDFAPLPPMKPVFLEMDNTTTVAIAVLTHTRSRVTKWTSGFESALTSHCASRVGPWAYRFSCFSCTCPWTDQICPHHRSRQFTWTDRWCSSRHELWTTL